MNETERVHAIVDEIEMLQQDIKSPENSIDVKRNCFTILKIYFLHRKIKEILNEPTSEEEEGE